VPYASLPPATRLVTKTFGIADADLSTRSHIQRTVADYFAVLRQLRSIRRSVPSSVFQTLVVALVLSRLDYGNATLVGLLANLINRLQSVLNAAARSVAGLRHQTTSLTLLPVFTRCEHLSESSLNWQSCLPSCSRHCTSVSELLHRIADITSRRSLRSSTSSELVISLSRLVTVGDRSLAVAGPRLWNTLPEDIISAPS